MLIALFFAVTLTVMTVQMCTREEYDISVMYAGNTILGDNASAQIEMAFEGLGAEGEKAVLYELIIMNDEEIGKAYEKGYTSASVSPEIVRKHKEALAFNVMSDEYFILMLSPECYHIMKSNNALEKLSDIGVSVCNGEAVDEYGVLLGSLDFAKNYTAFQALPTDTVLCFKRISEMNFDREEKVEKRAHDIDVFKKAIEFAAIS
jgi:hypothetical protein